MAVALTWIDDMSLGNKRGRTFVLTFSGNYSTNGETITAAQFGMTQIDGANFVGQVSAAGTPGTAVALGLVRSTDGTGLTIRSYESGSANAPFDEKTNGEPYITGQNARVTVVGW
jgi:hypothetical protein